MSDKSFGDHTNRNIVKNPLLSTAVTGLSLEDLTHKAVLLPVAPSLGQITRSDQQHGSQSRSLGHSNLETPTLPSGDAFSNISLSNIDQSANQNIINSQNNVKLENYRGTAATTQSQASLKFEDDFDVNEYIARLQGSRYVSAPLHSHLKEDQKATLEATEESLEEINLNESQGPEIQQSITADIAQNFSQLPNVLPHVASAVFSSFSNMLSYKSRDQTPHNPNVVPEPVNRGYDDVQFQSPDVGVSMMGMEEYHAPKEVAPPPKEPPIGGTSSSYRIATKKKYAQVPGLSSGDLSQTMTFSAPGHMHTGQNMPPIGQNMPPIGQNMPPIGQNMPPIGQNMPPLDYTMPPTGQKMPPTSQFMTPIGDNMPLEHNMPLGPNVPPVEQSKLNAQYKPTASIENVPSISQTIPFVPNIEPVGQHSIGSNIPSIFNPNDVNRSTETAKPENAYECNKNTQNVVISQSQFDVYNPNFPDNQENTGVTDIRNQHYSSAPNQSFFSPIEHKEQPHNIPNVQGSAAIIPPPPMFSNLPRKDSQSLPGKSVLPPSVARRISANQPFIKPAVSNISYNENIFVPAPVPETRESLDQSIPTSEFASANTAPLRSDQIRPPSGMPPPLQMNVPLHLPPSVPHSTSVFVSSNEEISHSQAHTYFMTESSQSSGETPNAMLFTPNESAPTVASTSRADSFTIPTLPMLPSTLPANVNAAFGTISADTLSNVPPANEPVSLFFTPGSSNLGPTNVPGPSGFNTVPSSNIQPLPLGNPPPTSFYNPLEHADLPKEKLHPITQPPPLPIDESPKPVAEPPKATGNVNFRMAKKRPQYYAGPIEGVGSISNNIKPVIAPVIPATEASNFQGSLFTPDEPIQPIADQYAAPNFSQASVPFDISRPMENVPTVFDVGQPQESYGISQQANYQQDYNTAFDMSRATTDMYDPPKQESKGFGIIGSLKSKLGSIDINKIQSTVTTFFDPAYNDTKVGESIVQDNAPYGNEQSFGQQQPHLATQGQSNFDIFVPNVEQSQYNQYQQSYDYNTNQYYQQPDLYSQSQGQHLYTMPSYPNSSSEQTHSTNLTYDSVQKQTPTTSYTQENIPNFFETSNNINTSFYNPNTFTQNVTEPAIEARETPVYVPSENKDYKTSDPIAPNPTVMENTHQTDAISQHTFDISAKLHQATPEQSKHIAETVLSENIQEPAFYNPNLFASEKQQTSKTFEDVGNDTQKSYHIGSNVNEIIDNTQIESQTTCDSALNTSKYNLSSIKPAEAQQNVLTNASLVSAASFFDMPLNVNESQFSCINQLNSKNSAHDLVKDNISNLQQRFEHVDLKDTNVTTMSPIGTKAKKYVDSSNKDQPLQENILIKSISKEEIPILGLSTVPLFGLSAVTADNTKDISFGIQTPANQNTDSSFDKQYSSSQPIDKNITKEIDITGLNISAVKNVLLIEPPQETIGAVLKNASSSKLEIQKSEVNPEVVRQQNEDLLRRSFFDHDSKGTADKEHKHLKAEGQGEELDMCETCREVNTPDILAKESVTTQMIGNLTSRMALSNPVTVPFAESSAPIEERSLFDNQQLDDITRIASDTMTTLLVQSATALLDDEITCSDVKQGWTTEDSAYLASQVDDDFSFQIQTNPAGLTDNDYEFKLDPNAIGFFGSNSLFFENLPTNASDEIKAEIKHSHEDVVLPRQMSIPSAPPAEDDSKSDETGCLDVHSIEQDAKNDFPIEEEFVIEPSETDDDKIEFRERKRSSEDSTNDTFTNRIERFKKTIDHSNEEAGEQKGSQVYGSPPVSMASYFDTGNYAVESHYRNSLSSPTSVNTFIYSGNVMRIPPGFEEEYARRLSGMSLSSGENKNEFTSDPASQAQLTSASLSQDIKENVIGFEMRKKENTQANTEAPENKFDTGYPMNWSHHEQPTDVFEPRHTIPEIPSQLEDESQYVKSVPNTTTQTHMAYATSYSSPLDARENIVGLEMRIKENIESYGKAVGETMMENVQRSTEFSDVAQIFKGFSNPHTVTGNLGQETENIKFVPNTSTQTKPVISTTFSNSQHNTEIFTDSVLKFTGFGSPEAKFGEDVKSEPSRTTQSSIAFSTIYSSPEAENIVDAELRNDEMINQAEYPQNVTTIPNTSTQTRVALSTAFTSPQDATTNISGQTVEQPFITDRAQPCTAFTNPPVTGQTGMNPINVQSLPDPMNFFSANVQETKPEEEPQNFNRLAMYFSTPPAQPDHSKSFFELSQSQNHYRHKPETRTDDAAKSFYDQNIDDNTKANIKKLMNDLTSPNNLKEQTVRTVNYFTVEYDNDALNGLNSNEKLDDNKPNSDANKKPNKVTKKCKYYDVIFNCGYCLNYFPGVVKDYNVRTVMNDRSQPRHTETSDIMPEKNTSSSRTTTVNFGNDDVEGQTDGGVTILTENRATAEYIPVKHHWFYRVEVEEKSVWRGFSLTDSRALEDAFRSSELNENTLVATDGGRFDVNVEGRLRLAVYWKEKPTNVRRCSWFYKGTTDARYVPYTEVVAEKLEEEYRHGITTGEWHRKLSLPNGEMVIMHGPSVIVHFLQSGATDVFSTPPNVLGKRVYRNPPKIRVARDQPPKVDHLILLVHGAGEYKRYPYLEATSRPRVVRRGTEESEIEDTEPSKIDHLLLLCHGVGSACDMRFRSVEEVVEDFRATSLQLIQSHYKNSYDNGIVSRVEVLPISWHAQLHSGETGVDRRLSRVTLDSIPRLRAFTNHTVLDVLFYTSPVFHQSIIDTVCFELNRIYSVFKERNPGFSGDVSLGGHSLGSVILYDLLCHQVPEPPIEKTPNTKSYVPGTSGTFQPPIKYPQLVFPPAALYALGSPIAIFECIRGVDLLGTDFSLPTCKNFFNIFHPYDPIAYRIEPLINPLLQEVKPSQIPHHKGRKRMHLELKDTMARVGADLKQKLMESLRTTWNKWKATPPTDGQLEKVVEEEMEKEQLCESSKEDQVSETASPEMLGKLNSGRRIDYVLQEAPLEMINEYLFAMSSHVGYWESEDTMLLMLREIYSSMGVQADCTVPQQSMTVQRTSFPQNEATIINEKEHPSTSRGST